MFSLFISLIIFFVGVCLSSSSFFSLSKATSFECGFDPVKEARTPFSIRFFLLAVIFLVFDIEIVLLFPLGVFIKWSLVSLLGFSSSVFILILFLGLLHEWQEGSLNWAE